MPRPDFLKDEDKQALTELANQTLALPFHFKATYWLAAKWDDEANSFKPMLVTVSYFDSKEDLELISFYYKWKTYIPENWDFEPESEIVTGSIDPKSGRRRIVIDPTAPETAAAPIKSQVNWGKVPKFEFPDLDLVLGWSKAADAKLDTDLATEGLFRPIKQSMAVRVEGMDQVLKYNSRLVPHEQISRKARELHLRFPESPFDIKMSRRTDFQCDFDRSQSGSIVLEWMRAAAPTAKYSTLRTLYETGHFDEFPFKIRATALLMSRGFATKEAASEIFLDQVVGMTERSRGVKLRQRLPHSDFERFRWIYSEDDFQRYRSVVDSVVSHLSCFAKTRRDPYSTQYEIRFGELWQRQRLTWSKLSDKQKEAAHLLRMGQTKQTFKAIAARLLIGVDALKERWTLVKRRFRKAFPEFKGFYPSKTHTKSKKGAFIYWGLYWHKRAAFVHEVRWTHYSVDGSDFKVLTPALYCGPKREKTKAFKDWQRDHRLKEEAVAKLDEPVDIETLQIEAKADLDETDITPDLFAAFRPNSKRHRDLSIVSPVEDDASAPPSM